MLVHLRDLENTVLVVEHDRDVILEADHIVDIGPKAGIFGGKICYEGDVAGLLKSDTVTGKHLLSLPDIKEDVRTFNKTLNLSDCKTNNLKNVSVEIPQRVLTVVSV